MQNNIEIYYWHCVSGSRCDNVVHLKCRKIHTPEKSGHLGGKNTKRVNKRRQNS